MKHEVLLLIRVCHDWLQRVFLLLYCIVLDIDALPVVR